MSKGMKALIGVFIGMIVEYCIWSIIRGEFIKIEEDILFGLLPGALIGAIVGFASGGKKDSPENAEPSIKQNTELQEKTAVSELLDYKKLLDAGIITQEEFDKKKQEILGSK
jgi:hypothetical protein